MEILTVKIKDNEIDYFSFGNGDEKMVIIPGLSLKSVMLSKDAIAQAYNIFSEKYTVYVFDRPKHLKADCTIEDIADASSLAMQALGLENACVFGASQGGMIAQVIALKYPKLVAKMVLGSSASRINDTLKSNLNAWVSFAQSRDVIGLNHSIFSLLYSKELLDSLGSALKELEKDGTDDEMERFAVLASACNGFDVYADLPKITCPTLVIGAKNDKVLTVDASVEMAEKMNCELYIYDAGHAVYDEALDYKERLYAFFDK